MHWTFHPKSLAALVLALTAIKCATFIRRLLILRRFAKKHGCQPIAKSYSNWPWLGLDKMAEVNRAVEKNRLLHFGWELYQTHGYTFVSNDLQNNKILTIEPENLKALLLTNWKDYSVNFRDWMFEPLLKRSIFNNDGDEWAASRALVRPSFATNFANDLELEEELIQNIFALIPRDGKTVVDLQELFIRLTLDSATKFLFGQSFGTLKDPDSEEGFQKAFNQALVSIQARRKLGPLSIFYRDDTVGFCRKWVRQAVDRAFDAIENEKGQKEQRSNTAHPKCILAREIAGRTTDRNQIVNELMSFFVAGRDTTSAMLGNLFFMLAKHPDKWEKLRTEISVLEGRLPTFEDIRSFKYLRCCLDESLRLHPVLPQNERKAIRDTVLPVGGGKDGLAPILVPKGTMVCFMNYSLHRRPDIYGPDAEEFRPERWEDGTLQPRWGYMPFNGGPRGCPGQRFAMNEAGYVVVRMVQEFKALESHNPRPWEEELWMALSSLDGAKVVLTPA